MLDPTIQNCTFQLLYLSHFTDPDGLKGNPCPHNDTKSMANISLTLRQICQSDCALEKRECPDFLRMVRMRSQLTLI